jgi:ribosome-dependent ATPase
MKMLTGLLPPTEGTATLFGKSVEAGSLEVRRNLGYMTQAFSLYGELTVRENLVLDARLYHLPSDKAKTRIEELVDKFGLRSHLDALAGDLPMGLRQRLSLAVAVLHEPEMLILDEPTSGVDPVARDSFWELLIDMSRNLGVTIFVTTHFMNEGMRCDRISLMHAGRVLACDSPQKLIDDRGASSLEEAFIGCMEDAIAEDVRGDASAVVEKPAIGLPGNVEHTALSPSRLALERTLAYTRNEAVQILRDPVRLLFAFVGSAVLMLAFGFGLTTDIEHVRYATMDLDQTPESRTYLEQFAGTTRYFTRMPAVQSPEEGLHRLQSDSISLLLEIPPHFGRNFRKGIPVEVLAQVDGADTFRGENVSQYVQGVQYTLLNDPANGLQYDSLGGMAQIEDRYMYNPSFLSIYSIVPSVPALLLILIPAILMAVSIVREKELGSMINFYVTPTRRIEYLIGKQIPYIVIGMLNFFILVMMALLVFGVPIKGNFLMLTLCTLLYVTVTTGIGMLISTVTSSQVAAVFITAIITIMPTIQFSGLLQPVSTLEGRARLIGSIWPTTYYMHSSVGAYTKGLRAGLMMPDLIFLACCIPILWGVSMMGLRKQER